MRRESILIVACALCVGCQTPGLPGLGNQAARQDPAGPAISANESQSQNASAEDRGFSFKRVLQFAGFQRSDDQEVSVMPRELAQLRDLVTTVVTKSGELSVSDPPEVTRRKAQEILQALRPWDNLLAAGRSLGIVDDTNAEALNGLVTQLKSQTQKLVQFGASPETIAAVQHLAGSVKTALGGVTGVFSEGVTAFRNLTGSRPR